MHGDPIEGAETAGSDVKAYLCASLLKDSNLEKVTVGKWAKPHGVATYRRVNLR